MQFGPAGIKAVHILVLVEQTDAIERKLQLQQTQQVQFIAGQLRIGFAQVVDQSVILFVDDELPIGKQRLIIPDRFCIFLALF